jgi:hypothetical protein
MGNWFKNVVLDCLRAVEDGFQGADEIGEGSTIVREEERVGLNYIDKFLVRLEAIRIWRRTQPLGRCALLLIVAP